MTTEVDYGMLAWLKISERVTRLAVFPHLGRSRANDLGPGTRSINSGEYVIVYAVEESGVLILRIVHGRRDLPALFDL